MKVVARWFGFGRDEIFEEGLDAMARGDYTLALDALNACAGHSSGTTLGERVRTAQCACHEELGRKRLADGLFKEALFHFEACLETHPQYADLNYRAALCSMGLEDAGRAAFYLARSRNQNPRFLGAALLAAIMQPADFEESGLCALAMINGENSELVERTMRSLRMEGASAALQTLVEELESEKAHMVYLKLGDSLVRENRMSEAAEMYRMAMGQKPGYADIHCRLGRALAYSGKTIEALEQLRVAISINPMYDEAHRAMAEIGSAPQPNLNQTAGVPSLMSTQAAKLKANFSKVNNRLSALFAPPGPGVDRAA